MNQDDVASSHRLDVISNLMWQVRYTKYLVPMAIKKRLFDIPSIASVKHS